MSSNKNKNLDDLENLNVIESEVQPEPQEVFKNDIELYLKIFCEENDFKSPHDMTQANWNAALMFIKSHVFKDRKCLKVSGPLKGYKNNNYDNYYKHLNESNCNAYNVDLVNKVCDIYIYLCQMYDKEISLIGFYNLTGVEINNLYNWKNNKYSDNVSKTGMLIYEKLIKNREESLSNKLSTGKHNPVGILAILNRHYQWNLPGVSKEKAAPQLISTDDLKKLDDIKVIENTDK